jgi:hypothetical protein
VTNFNGVKVEEKSIRMALERILQGKSSMKSDKLVRDSEGEEEEMIVLAGLMGLEYYSKIGGSLASTKVLGRFLMEELIMRGS